MSNIKTIHIDHRYADALYVGDHTTLADLLDYLAEVKATLEMTEDYGNEIELAHAIEMLDDILEER